MSSIAFSVSVGGKRLSKQAEYLFKSVRNYHPEGRIFAYVTEKEVSEISNERLSRIEDLATLIVGDMPIPTYPISAKVAAMKTAAERTDFQYLVSLDSDILLLDELSEYLSEAGSADVHMKPVDVSTTYWAQNGSSADWEFVASELGFDTPSRTIRSTVDNNQIYPYYNAGVIIAENKEFAYDWYQTTLNVYDVIKETDNSYYSDQIALGLLSQNYSVNELSEAENYPLPHYSGTPEDVTVLHHHGFDQLGRVSCDPVVSKLDEIGIWDSVPRPPQPRYYLYQIMAKIRYYSPF